MQWCYNMANSFQTLHSRHPIPHLWGRGMIDDYIQKLPLYLRCWDSSIQDRQRCHTLCVMFDDYLRKLPLYLRCWDSSRQDRQRCHTLCVMFDDYIQKLLLYLRCWDSRGHDGQRCHTLCVMFHDYSRSCRYICDVGTAADMMDRDAIRCV